MDMFDGSQPGRAGAATVLLPDISTVEAQIVNCQQFLKMDAGLGCYGRNDEKIAVNC
jgi:hypothetical protein